MRPEDVKSVQNSGQVGKTGTESSMGVALIEKVLLSYSTSILWSLISELQIIELFELFDLKIPAPWSTFAEYFDGVTSFDYVDTE